MKRWLLKKFLSNKWLKEQKTILYLIIGQYNDMDILTNLTFKLLFMVYLILINFY